MMASDDVGKHETARSNPLGKIALLAYLALIVAPVFLCMLAHDLLKNAAARLSGRRK